MGYFHLKMITNKTFNKISLPYFIKNSKFSFSRFSQNSQKQNSDYSSEDFIHSKVNKIINICSQHENIVIERFGQFHKIQKPGIFFSIPIIDNLRYCVDMRELTIPISPQNTITEDNVTVHLSGVIYTRIIDAKKSSYEINDPIYAIVQFAQATMRAVIGKHTLDQVFQQRNQINEYILSQITPTAENWGMTVQRYEITDVSVDHHIKDSMDKQASAERKRREDVLHAEANKKSQILESEGYKLKLINESEGRKIQVENEAAAEANSIKIRAEANKYEILLQAEARAEALKLIGEQLMKSEGEKAAQMELAMSYIKEFGEIVGKSNSLVIPNDMNDVGGVVTKALSIAELMKNKNNKI